MRCILLLQRPSVRINLNGDVPSVPIPISKRKPSLKNPGSGPRVSLYVPEKATSPVNRLSDRSKLAVPLLSRDSQSSKAFSSRGSSFAWLLGCDKTSKRGRGVVRWAEPKREMWKGWETPIHSKPSLLPHACNLRGAQYCMPTLLTCIWSCHNIACIQ